jgi:hypothetical protein
MGSHTYTKEDEDKLREEAERAFAEAKATVAAWNKDEPLKLLAALNHLRAIADYLAARPSHE